MWDGNNQAETLRASNLTYSSVFLPFFNRCFDSLTFSFFFFDMQMLLQALPVLMSGVCSQRSHSKIAQKALKPKRRGIAKGERLHMHPCLTSSAPEHPGGSRTSLAQPPAWPAANSPFPEMWMRHLLLRIDRRRLILS